MWSRATSVTAYGITPAHVLRVRPGVVTSRGKGDVGDDLGAQSRLLVDHRWVVRIRRFLGLRTANTVATDNAVSDTAGGKNN